MCSWLAKQTGSATCQPLY